ncbi:MAG: tyrosine-type recombinase/integrase [Armatimonadota bacterium]
MDLLDRLVSAQDTPRSGKSAASQPLHVLADWFYDACERDNLSPNTIRFYRQKLAWLLDGAGDRTAPEITTDHLWLLVQHYQRERHWSDGQTNHIITVWKVFFTYLEEVEGAIEISPARKGKFDKIKTDEVLPAPLSDDEVKRLLAAIDADYCGKRMMAQVLVMLDTGVRLGELMGMTVDAVNIANGQIRVFGKARKERVVPYSPEVRRALMKWLSVRKSTGTDALWTTDDGKKLTESYFVKLFRRLGETAKVDHLHPHRTRHTFGHDWVRGGGSLELLQVVLGHATPSMTQKYAHLANLEPAKAHRTASPVSRILGKAS